MLHSSLRFWRGSLVLMLALAVLAGAAFQQAAQKTKFTEIDVERINVVEADGTVKLVIANHDRAPDQVMDGRSAPRRENNKAPGITFFNDTGDEAGGLKVSGPTPHCGRRFWIGWLVEELWYSPVRITAIGATDTPWARLGETSLGGTCRE